MNIKTNIQKLENFEHEIAEELYRERTKIERLGALGLAALTLVSMVEFGRQVPVLAAEQVSSHPYSHESTSEKNEAGRMPVSFGVAMRSPHTSGR